jgi:hypothetical protein
LPKTPENRKQRHRRLGTVYHHQVVLTRANRGPQGLRYVEMEVAILEFGECRAAYIEYGDIGLTHEVAEEPIGLVGREEIGALQVYELRSLEHAPVGDEKNSKSTVQCRCQWTSNGSRRATQSVAEGPMGQLTIADAMAAVALRLTHHATSRTPNSAAS